jgi:signal transduction histidine kinase
VNASGGWPPSRPSGEPLDVAGTITENYSDPRLEVDLPEDGESEGLGDALEPLRAELERLRESRLRLVQAADADRRRIERELHGGVQQHLVALAVRLQLLESALGSDPAAARALLEEIGRDVQDAVDEAARLAQRIYLPLLELGLAASLRAAAVSAGVPASVEVSAGSRYSPEILHTVYTCWLEALEQPGDSDPAITVRDGGGVLVFDVVRGAGPSAAGLDALCDRVEALGGMLTIRPETGGGVRVSGSLPLSR